VYFAEQLAARQGNKQINKKQKTKSRKAAGRAD